MKVEMGDEEIPKVVRASEHYDAYLKATQREDSTYRQVADRLKKRGASA